MRRLVGAAALLALLAPGGAAAARSLVLEGGGWGHGVGMSQYGALGYAQHGWTYPRILAHYYRGTTLGVLPNRSVRVLVVDGAARVVVGSSKPFRRVAGREHGTVKAGDRALNAAGVAAAGGTIRFEPGASPLHVGANAYRGTIEVYVESGRLYAVNVLALDHYLRGVIAREVPDHWPQEALCAQAVVARSYTLATLRPAQRFDLFSDTRDQVYGGIAAETPATNAAVAATAGKVVLYDGRVATTYYFSTSGGRTANASDLASGLGAVPYLVSVPDPYDGLSRFHRWAPQTLSPAALGRRLKVGTLEDLRVTTSSSGRAASVSAIGSAGTRVLAGRDFQHLLGLRSTLFRVCVLSLEADPVGRAKPGGPVALTGFVRGGVPVRLQKAVGAGGWQPVRRLRLNAYGRFRTLVRPDAATRYRLEVMGAVGAEVRVSPR